MFRLLLKIALALTFFLAPVSAWSQVEKVLIRGFVDPTCQLPLKQDTGLLVGDRLVAFDMRLLWGTRCLKVDAGWQIQRLHFGNGTWVIGADPLTKDNAPFAALRQTPVWKSSAKVAELLTEKVPDAGRFWEATAAGNLQTLKSEGPLAVELNFLKSLGDLKEDFNRAIAGLKLCQRQDPTLAFEASFPAIKRQINRQASQRNWDEALELLRFASTFRFLNAADRDWVTWNLIVVLGRKNPNQPNPELEALVQGMMRRRPFVQGYGVLAYECYKRLQQNQREEDKTAFTQYVNSAREHYAKCVEAAEAPYLLDITEAWHGDLSEAELKTQKAVEDFFFSQDRLGAAWNAFSVAGLFSEDSGTGFTDMKSRWERLIKNLRDREGSDD